MNTTPTEMAMPNVEALSEDLRGALGASYGILSGLQAEIDGAKTDVKRAYFRKKFDKERGRFLSLLRLADKIAV